MATVARAEIEAQLRARKLDTTLTTAHPLEAPGHPNGAGAPRMADDQFVVATGIAALDERLGGGLARGQLSEIVGPRSSGRTSLVLSAMAGAASRGELVALVDTFDTFDPPSARACGLDLARLLWVRGHIDRERPKSEVRSPGSVRSPKWTSDLGPRTSDLGLRTSDDAYSQTIDRALKALNLILQAGGFGLVVLDLADASPSAIRRLPFTTWFRLQRPLEGSSTACVLLAGEPTARSAGGVTVVLRRVDATESKSPASARPPTRGSTCSPRPEPVEGRQPRWGALFTGFEVEAGIARARGIAETCAFFCRAGL
jgi:hypothetical protein